MADWVHAALALAIGLLLGSVLPADIFARMRGIEIRSVGDGNPGTVNAFKGLGVGLGVVTALYDMSVGVASLLIARALGTSTGVAYLAGIMAIVGHRFPIFRGFRGGGQGMAASAGLLLYGIGVGMASGWLGIVDIIAIVVIAATIFAFTRSDVMVALVLLPILAVRLVISLPDWEYLAFMLVVATNIWVVQLARRPHGLPVRLATALRGDPDAQQRGGTRG